MRNVLQLALAVAFPLVCLAMTLWLSHLEDTLPQSVRRSVRKPDPPPILTIPVQRRPVHDELPAAEEPASVPIYTAEGSRSAELSLGGSTNL